MNGLGLNNRSALRCRLQYLLHGLEPPPIFSSPRQYMRLNAARYFTFRSAEAYAISAKLAE